MKKFLAVSCITCCLLAGCIYDPPKNEKPMYIENQTNNFIYVSDSVPHSLALYDTYKVNKTKYVSARKNWIAPFTKSFFSFSNSEMANADSFITFYIIDGDKISLQPEVRNVAGTYRTKTIAMKKFKQNKINVVFVYPDTIIYTNEYSVTQN